MHDLVEAYLSSLPAERHRAFRALVAALKKDAAVSPEVVARNLRLVIQPDLDYSDAESLVRILKLLPTGARSGGRMKLAILGSFTTHQLASLIELFLFAAGLDLEIYESDYGVFRQEILDPASGLHAFRPDVLFLAVNRRDLANVPTYDDGPLRVRERIDAEVADWSGLWSAAHGHLACQIIQNNFDPPPWRAMSNHEPRHPAGLARFIARVNDALQEAAPAFVTIYDVDHLAASAGRWAWGDERFYFHAKLPCAPQFLVEYAHNVASLVAAHAGQAKKCLVLDLDNTLWGGVIGDDGIGRIRIGQGDAEGEAFLAFQKYVKQLRSRGVILAVCSKNEDSIAREVFEKHPEMALRLDDISCFVANWEDKASNLRKIARQLDIGVNSLVFVDDNPAERALVRQLLPEVAVPEMPEDPAGYIQAVERHAYFQAVSVGTEDLRRTDMYRANVLRQEAEGSAGSVDDFLASLRMIGMIEPVSDANIDRVVQLIGRSNQFNLTTRRHSAAAVLAMSRSSEYLTRAISLTDRFGDNGLISVLLARIAGADLVIDAWLMSCRVLKRGVEQFVLNHLVAEARRLGLARIVGEYIPTAKNALVRDHYAGLGFEKTSETSDGKTMWRLFIETAPIRPNFIVDKCELTEPNNRAQVAPLD